MTTTKKYIALSHGRIGWGDTLLKALAGIVGYTDPTTKEITLSAGNYIWDGRSGIVCGVRVGLVDGRDVDQIGADAAALAPTYTDKKTGRLHPNYGAAGVEYNRGSEVLARLRADGLV